jgi:hypothetical protein
VKDFQSKRKKPKEIEIKDDTRQDRVRAKIKRGAIGWGRPAWTRKPERYDRQYGSALPNFIRSVSEYLK